MSNFSLIWYWDLGEEDLSQIDQIMEIKEELKWSQVAW